MKSITKLFAGVLALAGILAGCQTLLDGSNLTISPEGAVELDKTKHEVTVAVTADCNWVASTDADWIKLSKTSGTVGSLDTIQVSVDWSKVSADASGLYFTITSSSSSAVQQ